MIDPTFIVFINDPQTAAEAQIIKKIQSFGFEPLVDGKHKKSKTWFIKNCVARHRLFLETGYSYTFDPEEPVAPLLGVFLNTIENSIDDIEANAKNELDQVDLWVRAKLFGVLEIDKDIEEIDLLLNRPAHIQSICSCEEDVSPDNTMYEFTYKYIPEEDFMIYQVTKPHVDKPYTTITNCFSESGHLPFFSSLFVCNSWGVCDQDIVFLQKLWNFLKMEGKYDCNKLVHQRIDACTPGPGRIPEPEPEVWRNDLESVLQILKNRRQGYILME